jgi:LysM repeat protein
MDPSSPTTATADASPDGQAPAPAPVPDAMLDSIAAACPYLAADGRAWRSATADRDHRCTAVGPAAALTMEKQRRLCLTAEHRACATYVAATTTDAGSEVADDDAVAREHVTRWALTRTTPVVLDRGRVPAALAALSPFKRGGQVALGGLMVVAFIAVLGGRLTAPDDRPAGAFDGSASPAASVSPSATRSTTPRPSPQTASPSIAPTPVPTVVPTPAPTQVTYTVRSGDTLSAIASRHGTTVAAIVALNGITDPSRLRVGQVLQIPAAP